MGGARGRGGVGGAGGAGDLGVLTCIQSTRAAHDLLPPSCLKIATFDMVNVNCDTHEHDTRTKSYVLKYSTVHVNFLYLKNDFKVSQERFNYFSFINQTYLGF